MKTTGGNKVTGIVQENPATSSNEKAFIDGSVRSSVMLRTAVVGFGTYQPGWRWSLHARPITGKDSENHIGYILSGRMKVQDPSGNEEELVPGAAFEIVAGSDAWVLGNEPCVALDFMPLAL